MERALSLELLTLADLKADPVACMLLSAGMSPSSVPQRQSGPEPVQAGVSDDFRRMLAEILARY
jgi:hypothetical protein